MAIKFFNAEAVPTNGTQLTTGNQGSGTGLAFLRGANSSITGTAAAGEVIHGDRSVKIVGPSGSYSYVSWPFTNAPAVGFRTYVRLSPTATDYGFQTIASGTAGNTIASVVLVKNGKLYVSSMGGATSFLTPQALTLPGVYGIDLTVQPGTTASNGKLKFAVYDAAGNLAGGMTAPFEATNWNTGTAAISAVNVGKPGGDAVAVTMMIDSLRASDSYGLLGPDGTVTSTAVIAGGAKTGLKAKSTRTLFSTGSIGSQFEWTRLSGTDVTIKNPNSQTASYVIPPGKTDSSVVIQLRVNDGTGWSVPVTVNDGIAKYPIWYRKASVLVPGTFEQHGQVGGITVSTSNITENTATLQWTAATGATSYLVGRDGTDSRGDGPWSQVNPANSTSQTFTRLLPSTTYTFYCTPQVGGVKQSIQVTTAAAPVAASADWSDQNLPWAYTDTSKFTEKWPSGLNIVNIQTGSSDFHTNLQNTVNAAGKRVIIRLGTGVYSVNQFRMIGSSGMSTYSFGFWHPNLQGFIGNGPDKTFIQMDANSMSATQLNDMKTMKSALFAPLLMGMCRLDGSAGSPLYVGGVTFRSADQQMLTQVASDVDAVVPQPAPHNGVVVYSGSHGVFSYVRFQAAGRAILSGPPFETANIGSQYGEIDYYNCEFDGRRSAALDPAQPRRCTVYMGNNETRAQHVDCWFHHSNVSRYAVNDENRNTNGDYILTRCKIEHINDNHNVDPALNGGQSLGGWENSSLLGYESVSGTVTINDSILSVDNPHVDGYRYSRHLQFTQVGGRNPQGGRLFVKGCTYRNPGFPTLEGYLTIRAISDTYWVMDGLNTTMDIRTADDVRLQPHVVSGAWPPDISSAGITPETHYIVRY